MKSLFVGFSFLFFPFLGKSEYLIFRGLLDKFNFRVISIGYVFFMVGLTVEDAIDVLKHSFKALVPHEFSLVLGWQLFCFFHQTAQKCSLFFFYLLLFLFNLHL